MPRSWGRALAALGLVAFAALSVGDVLAGSGARKAEELLEKGRYLEAAGAFEEAYAKTRDGYFLYRAAKAMEKSGDAAGSIRLYSRYLKTGLEAKERAEIEKKIAMLRGRSSGHGRDTSVCAKYVRCMRAMADAYERSDFPGAATSAKGMRDGAEAMSGVLSGPGAKSAASSCATGLKAMSDAESAFKSMKGFVFPVECRPSGTTAGAAAASVADFFGVLSYRTFVAENPGAACDPGERPGKSGRRPDGDWVPGGSCSETGVSFRGHPASVRYEFGYPGGAGSDPLLRRMRVGITEIRGTSPSIPEMFESMYGAPLHRSEPKKGEHTYRWFRGGVSVEVVRWNRRVACGHTALGGTGKAPPGDCNRYDVELRIGAR